MDWKNGINELLEQGVSIKDMAEETGLAVSSIYDLKNGYSNEPKGMAAVKLYALIEKLGTSAPPLKDAA
jgi:hypothetical protein